MASEEQETKNIEEMAARMAKDIAALNKKAGEMKLPSDLREIDLAPLMPAATAGLLKSAFTRLATESDKVQQEHEAQAEEQSQALEESIDARRQAVGQKMAELEKTGVEAGDTVSVVKLRMDQEVKRYEQRVVEIRQDKRVKAGQIVIRPGADAPKTDVTPETPIVKRATRKPSRKTPAP